MQHNSETETLLTPAEVAAMFRVDPKTVTRWAKAGKLSAIRLGDGGSLRIPAEALERFLKPAVPGATEEEVQ